MPMYTIILSNGDKLNLEADDIVVSLENRTVVFSFDEDYVGRFNIDHLAGWVKTRSITSIFDRTMEE